MPAGDEVDRDHVRHEVDVRMRGGGRFQRLLHRHAGGVVDMDAAAMAVATLLRQMPALSPCSAGIERDPKVGAAFDHRRRVFRSDGHTSELQSLMRHSYAAFCLKPNTLRT